MNIVNITAAELDLIEPLWNELNRWHHTHSTHFKDHFASFCFDQRTQALHKRDALRAFVAMQQGQAVAYCLVSVDNGVGEVDSLFVRAQQRGSGVGDTLMKRALGWLGQQDCSCIRVAIAEGNEQAMAFYRRYGFAERLIVMQQTSTK